MDQAERKQTRNKKRSKRVDCIDDTSQNLRALPPDREAEKMRQIEGGTARFPQIAHAKKRAFLAAYSEVGAVVRAAAIVDIVPRTHRNWLAEDEQYVAAFAEAEELSAQRMEAEALRRAVDGIDEPVYQGGQLVGYKRNYSDLLLIFMLKAKRPGVYRENTRVELTGADGKPLYAELMERLLEGRRLARGAVAEIEAPSSPGGEEK